MNKSLIFPTHENADYCSYEFDYQSDFVQFLEEARKNTKLSTSPREEEQLDVEKKSRKSWKNSLFSWLKSDKKSTTTKQSTTVYKPRRGQVSGPVQGNVAGNVVTIGRARRAVSGPLTGLFSRSMKRVDEYEVPYMCLGQFYDPHKFHSYGPLYLVT
ncbi:hypothetical protein BUALT_Bualt07G0171000 [Buddleja alternifolia]|uniref:Uncharacterized protein n=1 Tax=Buddleja alternifolia TaxID=168488 RepID=A0AAV6XCG1_9LAMI|nr:hypothetical protein BUALT_Bualt07G0171000 [Buddleja alternifolia]